MISAAFFKEAEPELTLSLKDDNPAMDFSSEYENASALGTRCSFEGLKVLRKDDPSLIISEVAWMGDKSSANNEWLELQNISEKDADLSGFELLNENGSVKIRFPKNFNLPPFGFALLKRSGEAAPEKNADLVYSGAIRNSKDGLRLFDSSCALLDEVQAVLTWPAGDNTDKKTMERRENRAWQTSAAPGGTPKAKNSVLKIVKNGKDGEKSENISAQKKAEAKKTIEGGEKEDENFQPENAITEATSTSADSSADKNGEKKSVENLAVKQCRFETSAAPSYDGIFINEVAWMGTASNANDEWFEIWNSTEKEKSVSGWQITDKNEDIKIILDAKTVLPPYGFLLFERTDDSSLPDEPADIIYAGALSNEDEGLRLFDSNCNQIDQALGLPTWPAGDNASKRTMERRKDRTWQSSAAPGGTPKKETSAIIVSGGGVSLPPFPPPNPQAKIPPKFSITEIMYDHPESDSDREWFEARNDGAEPADPAELKFFEDNTNHSISFSSGSSQVSPGGYVVIAKKPEKFLEDYPNHPGPLFSASFSFNNSGETVALKFEEAVIDEISYKSRDGGAGDGGSLQKIQGVWRGALPTPGRENPLTVSGLDDSGYLEESVSSFSVSTTAAILISEIQTGGADAGHEFIELYNSWDKPVDLSGWSLQYLNGTATSSEKIFKKNFEDSDIIPANGFFLIARETKDGSDGYGGSVPPDSTHRSFSLSGSSSGGVIFLAASTTKILSYDDGIISDFVAYGNTAFVSSTAPLPKKSESIERMVFFDGICVSAGGENEFLGNGCGFKDKATSSEIFSARLFPTPQNSKNLPEPRSFPAAPAPLPNASSIIAYDLEANEIIFEWTPSSDALGATSSVSYQILDSSSSVIFDGISAVFAVKPDEIGRDYLFFIRAFDAEGLSSPTGALSIFAPSPFELKSEFNASTSILRIFWNDEAPTSTIYEIAVTTSTEIADGDWQRTDENGKRELVLEADISYKYLIALRTLNESGEPSPFVRIIWSFRDE